MTSVHNFQLYFILFIHSHSGSLLCNFYIIIIPSTTYYARLFHSLGLQSSPPLSLSSPKPAAVRNHLISPRNSIRLSSQCMCSPRPCSSTMAHHRSFASIVEDQWRRRWCWFAFVVPLQMTKQSPLTRVQYASSPCHLHTVSLCRPCALSVLRFAVQ